VLLPAQVAVAVAHALVVLALVGQVAVVLVVLAGMVLLVQLTLVAAVAVLHTFRHSYHQVMVVQVS
jgi:hypothetical protein